MLFKYTHMHTHMHALLVDPSAEKDLKGTFWSTPPCPLKKDHKSTVRYKMPDPATH